MARWLGWADKDIQERLALLVELTHFPPDGLDRYPIQLSGGQRQRVSLMRALMLDPDVLLLDEPLGALDPLVRAELQSELRDIFRSLRKTVVMVTHDLNEAAFFGDVIVLLCEGRIVQRSTNGLSEFIRAPAEPFVKRFLQAQRTPPMNAEIVS
jgi:osmoprotectant transport system ATP-binding protein